MGKIQKLDWGTIDWIYEPEEGSLDNMRIGISRMMPGTEQPLHIHYGDEQLLYVLSGKGRQRIGGEESVLEKGSIYHISAGTAHESVNEGDTPIEKLLVSIPALTMAPKVRLNEAEWAKKQEHIDKPAFLRDTVRELFRSMLAPLRMPLSIYDSEQTLVYKSQEYPEHCRKNCHIDECPGNCVLIRKKDYWVPPYYEGTTASVCEHGIWVCAHPIVSEGEFLGYIKAGHVRKAGQSKHGESDRGLPYEVPDSTVLGIIQVVEKLSEAICNHYQFCLVQTQLQHNVRVLSDQEKKGELLQKSLRTTQDQAFNLQISQHFLFNTLNTIAGMAIREGGIQTYQAIGDLASLLRYTLRSDSYFVELSEEIDYLKNYTNLQKLRFGERLCVKYDISRELLWQKVPFHFLQPIVENCFKHGFREKTGKMKICVCAGLQSGMIRIEVSDNGGGMTGEELASLRQAVQYGDASHGTGMIARKLRSLYGDGFRYEVDSSLQGTTVVVEVPAEEGGYADEEDFTGR